MSFARTTALVLASVIGCSGPSEFDPCSGDVTVSVVRFDPPRLSWEPGCGLSSLDLVDAADRSMWQILADGGENILVPPITFGIVPKNATEQVEPTQFLHGNGYVVRVYRTHRQAHGGIQVFLAGEGNFRW